MSSAAKERKEAQESTEGDEGQEEAKAKDGGKAFDDDDHGLLRAHKVVVVV